MESFSPNLKSGIWVQAQLRLCDQRCIPFVIVKKGDPDAGAVLLKIVIAREDCRVYSRAYTLDGERGWFCGTGAVAVSEDVADAYIEKQLNYDRDIWVIEIEDPRSLYKFDAPIIE